MMKQFVNKIRFTVLSAIALLLMMSATSSASAETLRILTWEGDTPPEYQEKFVRLVKEKYGIDLNLDISYATSNDVFFPALRDNKADVISPSHSVPKNERYHLIRHKLVLPLNLDNIPNYKNVIPALQRVDCFTEAGKVYGVPLASGPHGLAYNTALVTKAPDTWNILWDPKFRGRYTIGNVYQHNINITVLAMGMEPDDISNYMKVNTPEFMEKLTYLAVNAHSLWKILDKPKDLKGLALATSWGTSFPRLKEMGEIWKFAEPKEGTTGWLDGFMISHTLEDKPRLRQIAEEWLNYVLSDDYQTYIARGMGYTPVITTIRDRLTPEEIERFHLDDPTHFEKHRILWKPLGKRDRKGLKRLWNKALKQRK
ncbi:extracellular solute-binding protein [Desulfobacterales bacterium HSG2]|nr:extracellular solute-binding protein [Desulfobacterales bacterium HSG2]